MSPKAPTFGVRGGKKGRDLERGGDVECSLSPSSDDGERSDSDDDDEVEDKEEGLAPRRRWRRLRSDRRSRERPRGRSLWRPVVRLVADLLRGRRVE